jgi:hypothetical protein
MMKYCDDMSLRGGAERRQSNLLADMGIASPLEPAASAARQSARNDMWTMEITSTDKYCLVMKSHETPCQCPLHHHT